MTDKESINKLAVSKRAKDLIKSQFYPQGNSTTKSVLHKLEV